MEEEIIRTIDESIEAKKAMKSIASRIAEAVGLIMKSIRQGGKIVVFGNGGSAADSQHFAAELVGRFEHERAPIPCIALTTNTSNLTAIANDYDFSFVFLKQVQALLSSGDTAIGISTSGNSKNVVLALKAAREKGAFTIAMTGAKGGEAEKAADICLAAPSSRTCRIQECHETMIHIICEQVEKLVMKEASETAQR
jgi:D-sedoheptulose 7-phosphate isomerase